MKSSHSESYMIFQSLGFARLMPDQMSYISTCTRPMITKYGKVWSCHEGLPPINSYNPKNNIYSLLHCLSSLNLSAHCLWSPNLTGWWHTARCSHQWIRITPLWGSLVKSYEKLNALYVCLQKIHVHYTA